MENDALASHTTIFGFWIYLMTDLILFSVLFAAYIVLQNSTFHGPTSQDIFSMPLALKETLVLLTSSFTCAIAMLSVHENKRPSAIAWYILTALLGAYFLQIEIAEFRELIHRHAGPSQSAFLSAFFTLVGTHGLHVTLGLIWMIVMIVLLWLRPLTTHTISRLFRMSLFWHFLDFIWIFIFTTVYSMGKLPHA